MKHENSKNINTRKRSLLHRRKKSILSDVNVFNDAGMTPLHRACLVGDELFARFLITHCSADVTLASRDGWSSLHLAACSGNWSIVKYIAAAVDQQRNMDSK